MHAGIDQHENRDDHAVLVFIEEVQREIDQCQEHEVGDESIGVAQKLHTNAPDGLGSAELRACGPESPAGIPLPYAKGVTVRHQPASAPRIPKARLTCTLQLPRAGSGGTSPVKFTAAGESEQRRPAICDGFKSREELQTKLIRGTSVYRNSHTLYEKDGFKSGRPI